MKKTKFIFFPARKKKCYKHRATIEPIYGNDKSENLAKLLAILRYASPLSVFTAFMLKLCDWFTINTLRIYKIPSRSFPDRATRIVTSAARRIVQETKSNKLFIRRRGENLTDVDLFVFSVLLENCTSNCGWKSASIMNIWHSTRSRSFETSSLALFQLAFAANL